MRSRRISTSHRRCPGLNAARHSVTLIAALAVLLSSCAVYRPSLPLPHSVALTDTKASPLARALAPQIEAHRPQSGFRVLASGHAAFFTRAALTEAARSTLDLQYFSVGNDRTTTLLLQRLVDAADRGVRIRVLLDDIHPAARVFAARAIGANPAIEVRLFNPFGYSAFIARAAEFLLTWDDLNRRMHNKLWIADNTMAIAGSRNLGDEYFDGTVDSNFRDVEVTVAGPVVQAMSVSFDAYWNSGAAIPAPQLLGASWIPDRDQARTALRDMTADCGDHPLCDPSGSEGLVRSMLAGDLEFTWAPALFESDQPLAEKIPVRSGIEHGELGDREWGRLTEREVLITSPYFIPGDDALAHIDEMRQRGIRVAVLTNSLASTDSVAAHAGYAAHRIHLLQRGVELYELRPEPGIGHQRRLHRWGRAMPDSLHAKVVVQDRQRVILGSLNQDPRSRLHNRESWLVIDSPVLAQEFAALFEESTDTYHVYVPLLEGSDAEPTVTWLTEEDRSLLRSDSEPHAGTWRRMLRSILGTIVPEHLL
jgi:putative cardiolipin synthase